MIPRYVRPEMEAVWAEETRYRILLEVEVLAMEGRAELGHIPRSSVEAIARLLRKPIDIGRIREIEQETRHETLAFLTYLSEAAGEEHSLHLHLGMTSSDALDTCLSVQLVRSADILLADLRELLAQLRRRALEFKHVLCIGRSHGIHAEPTTFGLKLAQAHCEFERAFQRIERAKHEISTGAVSGPVGTFATVPPEVEAHVCRGLGLRVEPVSTQVIPRDRHAQFFAALGIAASSVERLATEFRNLQRSEIQEVEEPFRRSQKGSSAMPHKRNPILSENLTGLARIVRAAVLPALENVVLWHERDMSHSSVERVIGPDATSALDFALWRLAGIVRDLKVKPENMERNLKLMRGVHNSHRVLDALVQKGLQRGLAYSIVQRDATRSITERADFLRILLQDPEVGEWLTGDELSGVFDDSFFIRNVDEVFDRVFGPHAH